MVRLNKPIKIENVLSDEDSTSGGKLQPESVEEKNVVDASLEKKKKKEDSEKKQRQLEHLLMIFSVMILIISISVLVYSILFLTNDWTPSYIYTNANRESAFTQIANEKPIHRLKELKGDPNFEDISAKSIYAFDPTTHQIYFEADEDLELPVASLTKLLTALVALEHFEMDSVLRADGITDERVEWVLGLKDGDYISFEDALNAMLINSYNDSAYVIAQNYPGGYEAFIEGMNIRASLIGMDQSQFENPAGLDHEENYSTATDLKKLVLLVLGNDTIMDIVRKKGSEVEIYSSELNSEDVIAENISTLGDLESSGYKSKIVKLESTNELLYSNPKFLGLKTGFTREAGPSFIGLYKVGENDHIVTIILNAVGNRFKETEKLVDSIDNHYIE